MERITMIESISAVTLATQNMPRAVRFYRVLGFEEGRCVVPVSSTVLAPSSQRDATMDSIPPSLVGISFLTSHKIIPLQPADMVAWEFYQYAHTLITRRAHQR
jgi:hypothetical protein